MPDASVMYTLLPVIVGGAIGILGGFVGPAFLHWRQLKEREKKHRAEKLEELHAQLFEVQRWIDTVRDSKFWDKEAPIGVSPVSKAFAISSVRRQII